jgi:hypothetical protein
VMVVKRNVHGKTYEYDGVFDCLMTTRDRAILDRLAATWQLSRSEVVRTLIRWQGELLAMETDDPFCVHKRP